MSVFRLSDTPASFFVCLAMDIDAYDRTVWESRFILELVEKKRGIEA